MRLLNAASEVEEPVFLAGAGGGQTELGTGRGDRRHMFGSNVFYAILSKANIVSIVSQRQSSFFGGTFLATVAGAELVDCPTGFL